MSLVSALTRLIVLVELTPIPLISVPRPHEGMNSAHRWVRRVASQNLVSKLWSWSGPPRCVPDSRPDNQYCRSFVTAFKSA